MFSYKDRLMKVEADFSARLRRKNFVLSGSVRLWLVLILCAGTNSLLSGCATQVPSNAVTEFDQAVSSASSSLEKYYQAANSSLRQKYLDELRFHPDMTAGQIAAISGQPYNTGLLYYFKPGDVQVRVVALEVLGNYARGLQVLNSNDAPERVEKSLTEIGGRLSSLDASVQTLLGDKGEKFETAGYGKPISAIAGMTLKIWLNKKRDAALQRSIQANAKTVDELFGRLESDVDVVHGVYVAAAKDSVRWRTEYFNQNLVAPKDAQGAIALTPEKLNLMKVDSNRQKFLQELATASANVAAIDIANPRPLIQSMRLAHKKLVVCTAQSGAAKSKSYLELLGNLQGFVSQSKKISIAVGQLIEHSKEQAIK